MRIGITATALALLVAACTPADTETPAPELNGPAFPTGVYDSCKASEYKQFIGQDATTLETELILAPVRVIYPGSLVTQDLLTKRINFMVDGNNTIYQITWG